MLGKNYVRATYKWQITSNNAYTLVAVSDERIIGIIAVCDGSFTWAMFKYCFKEFLLSITHKPRLLFNRKLWKRLLRRPNVNKKVKKIVNLSGFAQMTIGAVDKEHRGHGIFPKLVKATKAYSSLRGSRAVRAGIYRTNIPSRRVFIKEGWDEMPELETKDTVFYVAFLDPDFAKELKLK
jgi:GNAT superfamily N-acetyltransferase